MLKVGIVSAWHVHAAGYAQELFESGKVTIAAVWDDEEKRGKELAEKYNAKFISDYDEFLAVGDFTAVICGAPTTMHAELLCKAAAAGKNIFTEKLLAATTEDGEKICKAAEEAGIIFATSLPLLTNSSVLYVKDLIDKGELGQVTGARMRRSHGGVSDNWLPEYWFDTEKSGGGAMMDLGAHSVYVLSYLLGDPKRVTGMMTNIFGTTSDENAVVLVEYENGVIGMCETAFVTYGVPDLLEVYGTKGSFFMHGNKLTISTKNTADANGAVEVEPQNLPEKQISPLMQFAEACINGTKAPECLSARSALRMTKIIEAAYKSDKSGNAIEIK